MKARETKNGITTYPILPSTWNGKKGHYINFRNVDKKTLESEGFYDVVLASYDPLTQNRSGIAWDDKKKIFTNTVTDIDFSVEYDVLDEEGNPTGDKEKTYKIADIKASKIAEIKAKAGKLLKPTDWQVIRKAERGIDITTEVATERASILTEADRLEAEVNAKKSYKTALQYNVVFFPSTEEE
jgi:hypothetical protein